MGPTSREVFPQNEHVVTLRPRKPPLPDPESPPFEPDWEPEPDPEPESSVEFTGSLACLLFVGS